MNRNQIVTGLVISLSLFAAIFSALAWQKERPAAEVVLLRRIEQGAGTLGEKLDRVIESLEALALRVDRLAETAPGPEAAHRPPAGGSEGGGVRVDAETVQALVEKLDGIATRIERASAVDRAVGVVTAGAPQTETEEDRTRIVEENRPIAMDSRRPPAERLQALRELRFRDGRSREVVLSMVELMEMPELDPRMRADIIRNLDGVEIPELKDPLLRILENDRHPETRSETIETLQVFYGDPAVHAAVANVRDHDENVRVRMEALERLAQYEELKGSLEKAAGRLGTPFGF